SAAFSKFFSSIYLIANSLLFNKILSSFKNEGIRINKAKLQLMGSSPPLLVSCAESDIYWQSIPHLSYLVSLEILKWGYYCQLTGDKTNLKQKTEIKKVLLQQVLLRYSSDHNKSETYLEALTYFINFLFDLPKHNEEEVYSELEDFVKRSDINMNTEMPKRSPVLDELGRRLAGDYAEETRKEGIEEGIKKVAKKLIEKNFSNEQIVEITEIPLEEIKELRETNK